MEKTIGFIGLGVMGLPMAQNLLKAGYTVVAYNRSPQRLDILVEQGALRASSNADVAARSDVILTVLPDTADVWRVVCGEGGVLQGAHPGQVYIDHSSIQPEAAREIAQRCARRGVQMLDAPVSGGEAAAREGLLSIMAGGSDSAFEAVLPILSVLGDSVTLVGEVGSGNVAKLANQVLVALGLAAVSEAMTLCSKAGVPPQKVFEAIRGGAAQSWILDNKLPQMLQRDFAPGFRLSLQTKDLRNALETGHTYGSPLPLSALAMEMYSGQCARGEGGLDHAAVLHYYERIADVQLRAQQEGAHAEEGDPRK